MTISKKTEYNNFGSIPSKFTAYEFIHIYHPWSEKITLKILESVLLQITTENKWSKLFN